MSSPSKKIHKWTESQRTVLNLLNTQFDLEIDICTQTFNTVFKDDLDQAGIHEGLTSGQLKSQWRDRMHKGREHLWRSALQAPGPEAEKAAREELVGRIHDAAATLGVSTEGRVVAGSGDEDPRHHGSGQNVDDPPIGRHARKALRKLAMNGRPTNINGNTATVGENGTAYGHRRGSYVVTKKPPQRLYADEEAKSLVDEDEYNETEEEADEDDEYVDTNIREPRHAKSKPDENALEMLHTKDISWNADGASIGSLEGATIAHTSSYYKHGGEVRRITVRTDDSEADFMVCDASICPACSDPSAPLVLAPDEALPFVHSSDTTVVDRRTYFTPRPKARPQGKLTKTFLRYVQFKGFDGDVACWARVCGSVGCDMCMTGKTSINGYK